MTITSPALFPPENDDEYQVELPEFYGPMDLLLTLIEREELEITKIALAQVTDQYLGYVATMKALTPDHLTDFLVLASRLILLKSQVLLPRPPASIIALEDETETDDLVQQLKDYKRFKQVALELSEIEAAGQRSFIRLAPPPKIEPKLIVGDVSLGDLLAAVRRALAVQPEQPAVHTVIKRQVVSMGQQIDRIRRRLNDEETISFSDFLSDANSRLEVIITLLALLELAKRRIVNLAQSQNFGEITISKAAGVSLTEADWSALGGMGEMS